MSRRAWALGVPAAVLVLTALGFFYATSTPRYALYRLGVAMQRHDVATAERYFDVERIADRAAEVIVADYLARQPAPTTTARPEGSMLRERKARKSPGASVLWPTSASPSRAMQLAAPMRAATGCRRSTSCATAVL